MSDERKCEHNKLYWMDFANQPRLYEPCLLCRSQAKDERIAELERKRSAALQDLDEARSRLDTCRDAIQAMADDGYLYWGQEGPSDAQKKLLLAWEMFFLAPTVEDQWRSNCMGRKGSGVDEEPCPECDTDNPKPAPVVEKRGPIHHPKCGRPEGHPLGKGGCFCLSISGYREWEAAARVSEGQVP